MLLANKVVLITGGSRGLGKAMAERFAKEGAKIALTYNESEAKAQQVVTEIQAQGSDAVAIQCDISRAESIEKAVKAVIAKFGQINILVNNAGNIVRPGDSQSDLETWNKTLAINITGYWLLTKICVPYLKAQEGSSILNIASYVGMLGSQYVLPYGIAKAGVIYLTVAYAKELAPHIRVNAISPGNIDTDMTSSAGQDFINKTVNNTPLKRLGRPEEIASTAVFLVSDEASFITGINLIVDGGFMLLN